MNGNEKSGVFQVRQTGKLIVVNIVDPEISPLFDFSPYRGTFAALVADHGCEHFAFDLTSVRRISSGLLGLMVSIHRLGIKVYVYNPSPQNREILRATNLDRIIQPQEVSIP